MLRIGEVVSVDPERASVKVKFRDMDEEVSYELPVVHSKAGKDKVYWLPKIGDSVLCGMINETDGFVIGGYYHRDSKPPENTADKVLIIFEDGTRIEYDKRNHMLKISVQGDILIEATGNVTIKGSRIDLNP